jgi:hypothetical protein
VTVAELVKALQSQPPDRRVLLSNSVMGYDDVEIGLAHVELNASVDGEAHVYGKHDHSWNRTKTSVQCVIILRAG